MAQNLLPEEINGLVGKMTSPLIILGYHICQVHFKPCHVENIQIPMETSPMIPMQKSFAKCSSFR